MDGSCAGRAGKRKAYRHSHLMHSIQKSTDVCIYSPNPHKGQGYEYVESILNYTFFLIMFLHVKYFSMSGANPSPSSAFASNFAHAFLSLLSLSGTRKPAETSGFVPSQNVG